MIWLTSDWHFNHSREFIWKPRGFKSVEEMNEAIVKRHNSVVAPEDDVYVLGDLCLGGSDSLIQNGKLISSMNGKLHIVLGNHDTSRRAEMYATLPNVVEIAEVGIKLKYKKYNFMLTHYPMLTGNLERESLRQMTCNFYGHTHQKTNFYEDRPYMFHVGTDSHNCCPVLIDNAITEMNNKVQECVAKLDILEELATYNGIEQYAVDYAVNKDMYSYVDEFGNTVFDLKTNLIKEN